MADVVHSGLVQAVVVAKETALRHAANGVAYAVYGENALAGLELDKIVEAVPVKVAAALGKKAYYFVPLALGEERGEAVGHRGGGEATMVAPVYSAELADEATCHRNVSLDGVDGVFISTKLLSDRFALAFEFFINVGHAFVDVAGVPDTFVDLAWSQALADVRGETSQDAFESRGLMRVDGKVDEKEKFNYLESAFSDAVAIYMLSLAVDFDYSELREREYPLLAPQALAARLRLVAKLFPPNAGYEFSVRYRRRA